MTESHNRTGAMKAASWLAILSLTACAPYQFSKEVGDFSAGVDHISAAFAEGYTNLAVDRAAAQQRQMIDAQSKVTLAVSCLSLVGDDPATRLPCVLFPPGPREPTLSAAELIQSDTTEKLKLLGGYVHALQAVTKAADRTAFDDAAKRLGAAVGRIAASAGPVAPGADKIAPAVINLVFWVVGEALDRDRFDALRDGATKASEPVKTVATGLGTGLERISSARRTILSHETRELVRPLRPGLAPAVYKERLGQATATLARLDGVRQSNPATVTDALITAHETLVAAVNNPNPNYAEVLKKVENFATAAKGVHDALATAAK